MPMVSAAPTGGDVPPRAKSVRKPATKKVEAKKPGGGRQPKRKRFDDSKAEFNASLLFCVKRGRDDASDTERWRSDVRILSAKEWEAEQEAGDPEPWQWGAVEMEDGRILLCRLRPPGARNVYPDDHHHPTTAKAIRSFRSRLLDWLESQPDVGADPDVTLHGEGSCTITFGAPDDEGGHQAVDIRLSHNTELGVWY